MNTKQQVTDEQLQLRRSLIVSGVILSVVGLVIAIALKTSKNG